MDPDQKAKIYVATLKKILNSKNEGFKTFGALTGGALGSGVGGTVGLVKTINKHREGEMDDLDKVDKIKEYLKSMGGHAAAGLGAGALLGTGAGAAGKIRKVYKESRPGVDHIMEELKDPKGPLYIADAGKGAIRTAKKQPLFNMMNATKEQLQSMLGKKANEVYPIGFRRLVGGTGAAMGGAAGGVAGGLLGGLKGLIAPGEEKDESTGKMVQRDRIEAMLADAGKGGLIGGGIGAGAGLAGGAHLGHELRGALKGRPDHNILKNLLHGGRGYGGPGPGTREPRYRRKLMGGIMGGLAGYPGELLSNILQQLKERMGKTASAVPGVVPTGGPFNRVTGLKRNAARFYGARGGLVGTGVGAVGGALKGLVSPDEEVDPATGKKVEQGRLYSALTGGLKGGLIGGGIGAGLGAAGGAMRGAQLHPHFVAGANALHKANPNHLGPAAAVAGQVHVPYGSFAPNENMKIKQYLADLQAKMSAPPATP